MLSARKWADSICVTRNRYLAGYSHSQPTGMNPCWWIKVPAGVGTSRTMVPVAFSPGPSAEGKRSASFSHVNDEPDQTLPLKVVPFSAMTFHAYPARPNWGLTESARAGSVSMETLRARKCPLVGFEAYSDVH